MRVHRIEDDGCDQEVETVLKKVVNRHWYNAENCSGTHHGPTQKRTNCDSDQSMLCLSPPTIRSYADCEQDPSTDSSNDYNQQQRKRSLYGPPFNDRQRDSGRLRHRIS